MRQPYKRQNSAFRLFSLAGLGAKRKVPGAGVYVYVFVMVNVKVNACHCASLQVEGIPEEYQSDEKVYDYFTRLCFDKVDVMRTSKGTISSHIM